MAIPPRRRILHFKRSDTGLLIIAAVAYALLAIGLHLALPGVALTVLLGVNILFLVGLVIELRRRNDADRDAAVRRLQEIVALYSTLQPKRPFPLFTGWAASPELLSTIVQLIADRRPRHILELGSGASTVLASFVMKRNSDGFVTSLDHDHEFARQTRLELEAQGVSDRVHLHAAPLVPHQLEGASWMWYDLSDVPQTPGIDLLIVDGPPRETQRLARYPALPLLYERLSPGAVVVVDDAERDDEQEIVKRWLERYPEFRVRYRESTKGIAVLTRDGSSGEVE